MCYESALPVFPLPVTRLAFRALSSPFLVQAGDGPRETGNARRVTGNGKTVTANRIALSYGVLVSDVPALSLHDELELVGLEQWIIAKLERERRSFLQALD